MIIAGIGCRRGATVTQLRVALDAALAASGRDRACLAALAAPERKRHERALAELAKALRLPLRLIADDELLARKSDALTASPSAATHLNIAVSPAEAAALAAAGRNSRLVAPRTVTGYVVCALAEADP
ncbi:MAG: cobalamin biosynthesis protein [Rhodospirillales bacterium]|nr:cobalamin biosynthesis protein [Rhodospirillales bacterium]